MCGRSLLAAGSRQGGPGNIYYYSNDEYGVIRQTGLGGHLMRGMEGSVGDNVVELHHVSKAAAMPHVVGRTGTLGYQAQGSWVRISPVVMWL